MAYVSSDRVLHTGFAGVFATAVASVKAAMERRAEFTRTLRELEHLTDRDLADLGVHRSQIVDIARQSAGYK